ncbi:MAG: hypothetical protein WBG05_01890 [Thermoanaerobaculia bacterium]
MDLLSRIASWLGKNEATISAVVGITVLARVLDAVPDRVAGLDGYHGGWQPAASSHPFGSYL